MNTQTSSFFTSSNRPSHRRPPESSAVSTRKRGAQLKGLPRSAARRAHSSSEGGALAGSAGAQAQEPHQGRGGPPAFPLVASPPSPFLRLSHLSSSSFQICTQLLPRPPDLHWSTRLKRSLPTPHALRPYFSYYDLHSIAYWLISGQLPNRIEAVRAGPIGFFTAGLPVPRTVPAQSRCSENSIYGKNGSSCSGCCIWGFLHDHQDHCC